MSWAEIKKSINSDLSTPLNEKIENVETEVISVKTITNTINTGVNTVKSNLSSSTTSLSNKVEDVYGIIERGSVEKSVSQSLQNGDTITARYPFKNQTLTQTLLEVSGSGGITKLYLDSFVKWCPFSVSAKIILTITIDGVQKVFNITSNHAGTTDSADTSYAEYKVDYTTDFTKVFRTGNDDVFTKLNGFSDTVSAGRYFNGVKTLSSVLNDTLYRFNNSLKIEATSTLSANQTSSSYSGAQACNVTINYYIK